MNVYIYVYICLFFNYLCLVSLLFIVLGLNIVSRSALSIIHVSLCLQQLPERNHMSGQFRQLYITLLVCRQISFLLHFVFFLTMVSWYLYYLCIQ